MKGNCLAFDAFGQWFEHEGNKMRWMEKVGGVSVVINAYIYH
jgi:hypothetical protein